MHVLSGRSTNINARRLPQHYSFPSNSPNLFLYTLLILPISFTSTQIKMWFFTTYDIIWDRRRHKTSVITVTSATKLKRCERCIVRCTPSRIRHRIFIDTIQFSLMHLFHYFCTDGDLFGETSHSPILRKLNIAKISRFMES